MSCVIVSYMYLKGCTSCCITFFAKLHFVQNYLVQMIKPLFVVCYLRVYMYSFLWTFFLLFILWYYG